MGSYREGGCHCGAVRFRARGEPLDWSSCDCGYCRGLSRSGGPGEPLWADASVEFAGGPIRSVEHRPSDEPRRHERPLTVHFCPDCGVALSLSFAGRPGVRGMLSATFDDPGGIRREPPRAPRSAAADRGAGPGRDPVHGSDPRDEAPDAPPPGWRGPDRGRSGGSTPSPG